MQKTTVILTIRREIQGVHSETEAREQRNVWERYLQMQGWVVDGKELYTEEIGA